MRHWETGKAAASKDPRARRPAVFRLELNFRRRGEEVSVNNQTITQPQTVPLAAGRLAACGAAFILGLALIFLVGFAQPSVLHNAAHDSRHALAFPCH
jgi:cobalt transporter subunit CbtB